MSKKTKNIDIHAKPDGTFYWTKKYEKMLAEFEQSKPFECSYDGNGGYNPEIHPEHFQPEEMAFYEYYQAIKAGETLDLEKWSSFLADLFAMPDSYSFLLQHVFNQFCKAHLTQSIPIALTDLLSVYAHIVLASSAHPDNHVSTPDTEDLFIRKRIPSPVAEHPEYQALVTLAKKLMDAHPQSDSLHTELTLLFPQELGLMADMVADYHSAYLYRQDFMAFFDQPDIFANLYAYAFYHDISEPHLLLMIKHHGTAVTQAIKTSFSTYINTMYFGSGYEPFAKQYYGKVRKNLRILDAYHHVDVLDFLVEYANELEVVNFINKWIERYPIFTLSHLIENYAHKNSALGLIKSALHKNPLLIEPLIQALAGKEAEINEIKELTLGITPEQIQQEPDTKTQNKNQENQETGIPESLLNDDWKKATRKRNLELADYINQHSLPLLMLEETQKSLPKDVQARLLQILMLSDFKKPMPMLLLTLQHMSKNSQTTLANALWDEYLRLDMPKDDKWLMMASGFLYHDTLDDKVWRFIKEWESHPHKRASVKLTFAVLAQQAISHPNTKSADNALRMLIRISQKARATLRPPAQEQIERYAKTVGLSQDDMADKLIPTLGLDAQGKRMFDFGERHFTMSLDANLKPKFTDNNGKSFKNLPKAGKNDDADKANQAHAELKDLKKQLKEFIRDDVPRMENMLLTQRRLNFANFKAFYVNNPLMLRYSYQLVWGVFDKDNTDKLIQPFRVVETGEILDINDDELTISDDAFIGLVHPIQLTEEQKQQLSQSLQDDEIIQPFAQLARSVYFLTDEEKNKQTIIRFNDEKFATGSLIGFKNKGWEPYQIGGGYCEGYSKTVNGHELFFQFTGFGLWEGVPADDKGQELQPIQLNKKMSDIDISEFIYVLDSMARL